MNPFAHYVYSLLAFLKQGFRKRFVSSLLTLTLFSTALSCALQLNRPTADIEPPPLLAVANTNESLAPLPLQIESLNPNKVALGQQLFADPRLSKTNTVSCASCHSLQQGGTDQKVVSTGINGSMGKFNAPSIFNSAFNFRQFWDGRADSLEAQIDETLKSPTEMGLSWQEAVLKVGQDQKYRQQFQSIYRPADDTYNDSTTLASEITPETIKDAIATYVRSLITPNAPLDRYLKGDRKALDIKQQKGYERFVAYGCVSCHQGINIGGNMLQKFGIFGNYYKDVQEVDPADWGYYNVTGKEADRYVFKVPSLRNVALTRPYFHDGSVETLQDAISIMGQYQLGRALTPKDLDFIERFLDSLTGETSVALNIQAEDEA